MKFKKTFTIIFVFALIISLPFINYYIPAFTSSNDAYADGIITLFSSDGRTLNVYESEVESYLKLGWFRSFNDVTSKIYATDGRTATVYNSEVNTYLSLGWYSSYEEVTQTLFAPDGRTIVVYKDEVAAYKNVGWRIRPNVDPTKPTVALTFDDGPSPHYTKRIVDTLLKYNCAATFFVVGEFVAKYPDITKYTYDNGMEIGNHTYTHADLARSSASVIKNQIANTSAEIKLATGISPTLVRPPYGSTNENVKLYGGLPQILWSIDTLDWKTRNANSVFNEVAGKVKDGDIILMHDLYKSTADAVDMIVPYLVNRGFQIVDVSTLAKCKGYTLATDGVYRMFR